MRISSNERENKVMSIKMNWHQPFNLENFCEMNHTLQLKLGSLRLQVSRIYKESVESSSIRMEALVSPETDKQHSTPAAIYLGKVYDTPSDECSCHPSCSIEIYQISIQG